jgi:hypothetical protein
VHREQAQRLYHEEKAFPQTGRGSVVRALFLLDHSPENVTSITGNSCRSVYKETLDGGRKLRIETTTTIQPREVTTQPCHVFKLKPISPLLKPYYEAVIPRGKNSLS